MISWRNRKNSNTFGLKKSILSTAMYNPDCSLQKNVKKEYLWSKQKICDLQASHDLSYIYSCSTESSTGNILSKVCKWLAMPLCIYAHANHVYFLSCIIFSSSLQSESNFMLKLWYFIRWIQQHIFVSHLCIPTNMFAHLHMHPKKKKKKKSWIFIKNILKLGKKAEAADNGILILKLWQVNSEHQYL